jgi:hypothetical protein
MAKAILLIANFFTALKHGAIQGKDHEFEMLLHVFLTFVDLVTNKLFPFLVGDNSNKGELLNLIALFLPCPSGRG